MFRVSLRFSLAILTCVSVIFAWSKARVDVDAEFFMNPCIELKSGECVNIFINSKSGYELIDADAKILSFSKVESLSDDVFWHGNVRMRTSNLSKDKMDVNKNILLICENGKMRLARCGDGGIFLLLRSIGVLCITTPIWFFPYRILNARFEKNKYPKDSLKTPTRLEWVMASSIGILLSGFFFWLTTNL